MTKKFSKKKLKGVNKRFHELAAELPMAFYSANEYGMMEVETVESRGMKNYDGHAPEIISESVKVPGVREQHYPINHFKRLRKAYAKEGELGVAKYIKWVYGNNERVLKEHQMKVSMMSIEQILKQKIKPIFA